jgi:Holliday junction resolvase RusA-like endonuclease
MSVLRKTAQWVSLRLPTAPLVNRLHRTIVRPGARFATLIKSEQYREWLINAGKQLELQNPACVQGYFGISIGIPHKSRGDLDGYLKATLDLLQAHGVIDNDRFCQRILIQKSIEEEMTISIVATKQVAEHANAAAAMGTLQASSGKARRRSKASDSDNSCDGGTSESGSTEDNSGKLAASRHSE